MKFLFAIIFIAALLFGCADAAVKPGGTTATIDNRGGVIQGSATNAATTGDVTGGTATQTTSTDLRLALDPSSFSTIFGDIPSVKPTDKQLSMLEGLAAGQTADKESEILAIIQKCKEAGDKCVLEPK